MSNTENLAKEWNQKLNWIDFEICSDAHLHGIRADLPGPDESSLLLKELVERLARLPHVRRLEILNEIKAWIYMQIEAEHINLRNEIEQSTAQIQELEKMLKNER